MPTPSEAETSFQPISPVLQTLLARGYVNQSTNMAGLDEAFCAGIVPAYVGFDATADSLHVGHLLPIMTLRRLQQAGHKPIVLIGGGTTRIGDPSFRSDARPMLDDAQIAANIAGIASVFARFLKFGDGPSDAMLVDNADWLDGLRYIDMLRDIGRHFSVNRMLSFDSVRTRLEAQENLSFLEFNYMILQSYDFLELSRRMGCRLQMGGADQWGNIVNGIDLVRRIEGREVFGLTAPLLTTSSGAKMGKTAAGAVWLNAERLSSFDYWQFWRNTEDADVGRFLRLFTDLPMDEIAALEQAEGAALNAVKVHLAHAATALAHGSDAADAAGRAAQKLFTGRAAGEGLPLLDLDEAAPGAGLSLAQVLVEAGFAETRSAARRSIAGRGVRLEGEVVDDEELKLSVSAAPVRLSLGRKRHVMVQIRGAAPAG